MLAFTIWRSLRSEHIAIFQVLFSAQHRAVIDNFHTVQK